MAIYIAFLVSRYRKKYERGTILRGITLFTINQAFISQLYDLEKIIDLVPKYILK